MVTGSGLKALGFSFLIESQLLSESEWEVEAGVASGAAAAFITGPPSKSR